MRLQTSGEKCEETMGNSFPKGKYHVKLILVEEKPDGDNPSTAFSFEYQAGTSDLPVNSIHRESIFWFGAKDEHTQRNQDKICLIALRAGAKFKDSKGNIFPTTKETLKQAHDAGEDVIFQWQEVIDREPHLFIEIDSYHSTKKDKTYFNLASGAVWEPDDRRAADIPRNADALIKANADDTF